MANRTRKNSLYIAAESAFSTDPSSSGSGYLHIPAVSVGELSDQIEMVDSSFMIGTNRATRTLVGRDGWSIDLEGPVIGLAAAAGSGATAASTDWFNLILAHVLGTGSARDGEDVSSATASTISLVAMDTHSAQDLLCVHEPALFGGGNRSQWRQVESETAGPVYTVGYDFEATPTSSAVSYGSMNYRPANDEGNAATLALCLVQDQDTYTLLGGRVTSFSITAETTGFVKFSASIQGDRKIRDNTNKISLPTTAPAVTPTPVRAMLSPISFPNPAGGNTIATSKFSIDFGITASAIESTEGAQGRAGFESTGLAPKISIEPLFQDDLVDMKRDAENNVFGIMVQMGAGELSTGVLNTCAFFAPAVQIVEASSADDGGRRRANLSLKVVDAGQFGGGASRSDYFVFSRA